MSSLKRILYKLLGMAAILKWFTKICPQTILIEVLHPKTYDQMFVKIDKALGCHRGGTQTITLSAVSK